VGFLNTEAQVEPQKEAYYKDADWIALQEIWDRLAYPGLFSKDEPSDSPTEEAEKNPDRDKWGKHYTILKPLVSKLKKKTEKDDGEENVPEPLQ